MYRKDIVYVAMFFIVIMTSCAHEYCSTDQEPYRLFGEKTFYSLVGGKLPSQSERAPSYCRPIFISIMIRHGARYPKRTKAFPSFYELTDLSRLINSTGTASQCKNDIESLKNWKIWLSSQYDDANVTQAGKDEMRGVAERYKALFPEILASSVPATRFWFSSTEKIQNIQSLPPFQRGILEDLNDPTTTQTRLDQSNVVIPPLKNDPFHTGNCLKYTREISRNETVVSDYLAFKRGPKIQNIARNLIRRLGLPEGSVDSDVIWKMYFKGCILQQWVEGHNGPWCSAFTNEELEVINYADDLRNYARKSTRIPLSYEKNCFASKEIINSLISSRAADINNEDHFAGRFRIVHVSNVVTTAANFRLYEIDEPPNSQNFESQRNRTFNFSHMIPTAGHLAFVLYRCEQVHSQSDYQVQIFWNERIVPIPGCSDSLGDKAMGLCSLDDVINNIYPNFVSGNEEECDQEKICSI